MTLAGVRAKPSEQVAAGDVVTVLVPPPVPAQAQPEDLPLEVLYEDGALLVLVKAAGMVVHPAAGVRSGTLVNALLFHCHDLQGIGGTLRPGIVHRLDKGTTGVMVVAKSDAAYAGLAPQFKAHTILRRYLALVHGRVEEERGIIDTLYGRDPYNRLRFSTRVREGRRAVTHWEVAERHEGLTLVRLRLQTGRTHQIRVHMSESGHPLLGDATYGGATLSPRVSTAAREAIRTLDHQLLHAFELGFVHPTTGETLHFSAPPPADFEAVLLRLRADTAAAAQRSAP